MKYKTKGIHCCDKTEDKECGESCKKILQTMKSSQDIIDGLVNACGLPFPIEASPNVNISLRKFLYLFLYQFKL